MNKIIHILPYDSIGGVEAAARSIRSGAYPSFLFQKYYIDSRAGRSLQRGWDESGHFNSPADPRKYLQALLWLHRRRPQLLIASLWRSYVVAVVYKLLHPGSKVVCFLHSSRAVHLVDWFLAFGAMAMATEIWTDSQTTLNSRVPQFLRTRAIVISFVLRRLHPASQENPAPQILFWGRLAPEKGLNRALRIIAALKREVPNIQFKIIGPDQGELYRLKLLADDLGVGSVVTFLGPKNYEEIVNLAKHASFYLQTSMFEGMAISVVEAMQLGLVPVVTPVGEIGRYCHDGFNALYINSEDPMHTANRIKQLLIDSCQFASMREEAIKSWVNARLYQEDVLGRCRMLLRV